jgi:hypothetical protein
MPERPGPASTTWPSTSTDCRVCSCRTSSQGRSLEARHPRGLMKEQGRNQEAPSFQERSMGHNLEPRSCQARVVGCLQEARSFQGRAVGHNSLQEARSSPRERWGTTVSRRLAAPGASDGAQQSAGGSQLPGASGGQLGSSHKVAGSTAVETPQAAGDPRRRQIHSLDPLTYPRDQTHAAARALKLHKKPRRC